MSRLKSLTVPVSAHCQLIARCSIHSEPVNKNRPSSPRRLQSVRKRRCDALFAIVGGELCAGTCFLPAYVTFLPLPSDSGFHSETLSVSCRICYFSHSVAVHWSADRRVHSALHSASRRSKTSYSGLCCCCSGCCSGGGDDDDDSDAAVRSSRTRNATWLRLAGGRNRKKSRTASNRRHRKMAVPSHTCRSPCQDRTPPPSAPTGSRSVWMDLLQRERHKRCNSTCCILVK